MEEKPVGIDLRTPINASLTAFYQRSMAYDTIKRRLPNILCYTVDVLSKKKGDILKERGEDAEEDFKIILNEIGNLKTEIQNNKPLRKLDGNAPDIELYNKYLEQQSIKISCPTYYNASWVYVECYMYRRIQEAIEQTKLFQNFDPFEHQKQETYSRALQSMALTGAFLLSILTSTEGPNEQDFVKLIKLNVWSNKTDLAFTMGRFKNDLEEMLNVDKLNPNVLCDDSLAIWDALTESTSSQIVDIVLDNTGYELFTDMCIADFIVKHKFAQQVRFFPKSIPWYVSDVMTKDFHWTIHQLKVSKNSTLKKLGERWSNYIRIKTWTTEEHIFWTLPPTYKDMDKWALDLYRNLSESKLIIFKGDLNYRKLVGERNWPPTTPFEQALEEFHPSKLCTLRALKAPVICGLANGVAEDAEAKEKDWLITGNFAVIQFCPKIVRK